MLGYTESTTKGSSMTHPSRVKGFNFEREVVNLARDSGLDAERAYGSNGEAMGHHATVDVVIEGWRLQASRTKGPAVREKIRPSDNLDGAVARGDGEPAVVVIPLTAFLDILKELKNGRQAEETSGRQPQG